MLSRNDSVDNGGRPPAQQQQQQQQQQPANRMTGDYTVLGTSSDDSSSPSSYAVPQPTRNRLADRIRQLQQQQNQDEGVVTTSTTSTLNSDENNELYLQVKQGIVQIKSKEQHT